jgi:hypothetical protein
MGRWCCSAVEEARGTRQPSTSNPFDAGALSAFEPHLDKTGFGCDLQTNDPQRPGKWWRAPVTREGPGLTNLLKD